jgi:GTP-binding protein YchF
MTLSCGIAGLPNVGKSTLFVALTGSESPRAPYAFTTIEPHVAVAAVPDERLATLNRYVATQRIVPADFQVVDIPALTAGSYKGEGLGNKFLGTVKETDAILHIVQCFERSDLGRETPVDPKRDIETLELELAMADHDTVARNIERVSKKARAGDDKASAEKRTFERAKEHLENGGQLRLLDWKRDELQALKPLFLLTMKPVLYVANVGDDDLAGEGRFARAVAAHAEASGARWIPISCDIECELRGMSTDDRAMFMGELGIEELSLPRLLRAAYDLLGMQTYFTAGEKEIRAWTILKGDTAPVAAGKIHSDFEKKFIKAELYSVDDLVEFESEAAIKAAGRMRLEGRDYVMRESDVAHFLIGK